jgi:hypothetical protein
LIYDVPKCKEEARALLTEGDGSEDPLFLDFPPKNFVDIGALKDGVMHVEWSGRLDCEYGCFVGEDDYTCVLSTSTCSRSM